MTWLVLAGLYAGLLGVSFGRVIAHMRRTRRNLPALGTTREDWDRRALDVTLLGSASVALGVRITAAAGRSVAMQVRTSDGVDLAIPAGLHVDVGARAASVVEGMCAAPAGTELTIYVSSHIPGEPALRASWRVPSDARLIIVDRGASPVADTIARMQRSWRVGRVALLAGCAAALIAAAAVSHVAVWLATLVALLLAVDACFWHSAFVVLTTTRHAALPERSS
jgi:hypothetical protein